MDYAGLSVMFGLLGGGLVVVIVRRILEERQLRRVERFLGRRLDR